MGKSGLCKGGSVSDMTQLKLHQSQLPLDFEGVCIENTSHLGY